MNGIKDPTDEMEVIFAYTRSDALRDGVLRDVSETAREAGFKVPVAVTDAVWQEYIRVPEGVECQDEAGRLWDILWMSRAQIAWCADGRNEVLFTVLVRNDNERAKPVTLKFVGHAGDNGERVGTIMLPHED